jgi:hypothetical protein
MKARGEEFNILTKRDYFSLRKGSENIAFAKSKTEVQKAKTGGGSIAAKSNGKILIDEIQKKQIDLYSSVKKSFTSYLKKNNFQVERVSLIEGSHFRNLDYWNELKEGETFCYIDIKHAYWQYALALGYIPQSLYDNVLQDVYKKHRNKALACTTSDMQCEYFKNGKSILKVNDYNEPYKTIYQNIRYSVYNDLFYLKSVIGEQNVLAIKVDCIMFNELCFQEVFKFLSARKLKYRVKTGRKILKDVYYFDNEFQPKIF